MIDARHLAMGPREIWIPGFAANNTTGWIPIHLPTEAQTVEFTLIGGGGGGGRGPIGGALPGGGGGGTGAVTRGIFGASVLPKLIYASIGANVPGGAANNTAGSNGIASYISVLPTTNDEDVVLYANGGGGGAGGGAAGTAAGIAVITSMDMANLGTWQATAGVAGSAGNAVSGSAALLNGLFISGGAGGGGANGGAGGNQTSSSPLYPTLSGGATGDNPGANGIILQRPLICIGGAGGGGINGAGAGNNRGGAGGGYGSGGGGGGNAVSGQSGNGGNGAPGLLIMRWW